MRQLRNFSLSPFCRKIRLVLGEKKLPFESVPLRPWENRVTLSALSELLEADGTSLTDSRAIAEFLNEQDSSMDLLPGHPVDRAVVRRWVNHFDECFWRDVTWIILHERIIKRFSDEADRQPDLAAIKLAQHNLRNELQSVDRALEKHGYVTVAFSLADLTVAAHLSCLDYFGDVPWQFFPNVKEWYARMKSRPSFRPLLNDQLPGFPPSPHYADLDF
ncbi:MAG: glutathione S-transferase family protein [Micropepsaceae bacterium]